MDIKYVKLKHEPIVMACRIGVVTGHLYPTKWWSYVVLPH